MLEHVHADDGIDRGVREGQLADVREQERRLRHLAMGLEESLGDEIDADQARVGQEFYERAVAQRDSGGTPLEVGARLAVYLGSAASDGITGRLISAVWDAWESLAERREVLASSDVYTLRRIVPQDRGLAWDRPA